MLRSCQLSSELMYCRSDGSGSSASVVATTVFLESSRRRCPPGTALGPREHPLLSMSSHHRSAPARPCTETCSSYAAPQLLPRYFPTVAVPWQVTSVQPLPVDMSLHHRTAPATPWKETCSSYAVWQLRPRYFPTVAVP
jgi:hypothetical protein